MAEMTYIQAISDALRLEMRRDPRVFVMGEDVGRAGGVFRATAGLRDRFGADRCVDTPLAEAEAESDPDPELVFDNAYVLPPPNLREGWDG